MAASSEFVDGLASLDAAETRRRLGAVMAAVKAASEAAGGDGALLGTLHRVEASLLVVARRGVKDLAEVLAAHEAELAAPAEKPAAPPSAFDPAPPGRLPRLARPQIPPRRPT